jgi:ABC-2 type transport system permease protein
MSIQIEQSTEPVAATLAGTPSTWAISQQLAIRSLRRIRRLPSAFLPSLVMPIFLTLSFASVYRGVTLLPDFPTRNAFSWFVPMAALQGAAFGAISMGFGALGDMAIGFADRLLLAPQARAAMVIGPMYASLLRVIAPFAAAVMIGLIAGIDAPGGVGSYGILLATCALVGLVFVPWSLGLAYRIKSQAAAGPMQASVMFTFFLSAAQMPLSEMNGWLHAIARVNPMTNVFRMARQGFVGDITWAHTWPALLTFALTIPLAVLWASRSIRRLVP